MLISEIEENLASGLLSGDFQKIVKIFLTAINDWPNTVIELDEYVCQIERYIGECPSKKSIEQSLKSINVVKQAWNAESLSEILNIFQFYPHEMVLLDIVADVYRKLCESKVQD